MNIIEQYQAILADTLERAFAVNKDALQEGAALLAKANLEGNNIFAFGCSHAMLPMLELYYRTGGMATINPVRAPGLCLDIDPATMTSQMERIPGYGKVIIDALPMKAGDVLLVHSVSGRNAVPIDAALRAKELGAKIVVLTSRAMTDAVTSRHPAGLKLCDTADILLDNGGCVGDAAVEIPGVPEKVAPTSTSVAAALLNAMMAQAVELIVSAGGVAPVFVSANLDGGDEHNKAMMANYGDHIFYM